MQSLFTTSLSGLGCIQVQICCLAGQFTFENDRGSNIDSVDNYQRWSRGNKARGRGQGHKKNLTPRPRIALPRTDILEAKDSIAAAVGVYRLVNLVFKVFNSANSDAISAIHRIAELKFNEGYNSKFALDTATSKTKVHNKQIVDHA